MSSARARRSALPSARYSAGPPAVNSVRLHQLDKLRRPAVEIPGGFIVVVVRKVGRDQDQRFRPAPERPEDPPELGRVRIADEDGNDREILEHRLQERDVHLDTVLAREHGVVDSETGDRLQGLDRRPVHRDRTERRAPSQWKRISALRSAP